MVGLKASAFAGAFFIAFLYTPVKINYTTPDLPPPNQPNPLMKVKPSYNKKFQKSERFNPQISFGTPPPT